MCENTCVANYASGVILTEIMIPGAAPIEDFTLHQWNTCAADVKQKTDGVTASGNIDYRITRTKSCKNPCCVAIQVNDNTCPQLDCSNTDFSMPWNINYER